MSKTELFQKIVIAESATRGIIGVNPLLLMVGLERIKNNPNMEVGSQEWLSAIDSVLMPASKFKQMT